ncbi:DUF3211 domain-containing protein [Saccharolobus solfataricus]|uniref:DUF3211 domain-containing protein n=2 Tax=Saccharolobus solfataricus TaxID=2287 RepID=A0A0E3MDC9_SACSO|nr:STK_08120 family protein [Saccharolobus solfataricus]AKA74393.1 DUF3211 domain-containing protein [Saccharolobus solfataricus]AKA77088.1 DUF3211 domain-containing protein [Saccharolobus solfataricus]AKA79781.1 DUF3211 domain-containing protein [Saccharolobus solfataricus]AZF68873.1 DUF3211 domain-containing protein [Saccharolobus solfataricus]AZF71493.1 DUF3211 domain-containing protein [Saccharolobus solfataricus]
MQDKIEIYGEEYDEKLSVILADPNFLITNLLGASNVDIKEGDFTAEVPLSALLGKATIVIYGKVFRSLNSITYVINVAGYGPDKGGKIRVQLEKGKIIIDVEFNIPLGFLNARLIKSRIADFKNKANELIRLERIKRKI